MPQARVLVSLLLVLLLGNMRPRPVGATCPCGDDLELVLVIDCTASMKHMIGTVKAQAEKIIHVLEANLARVRVGLVPYRTDAELSYIEKRGQPLTRDRKKIIAAIKALRARNGGLEACAAGLQKAITGMKWSRGARKVVVLIGDEGPEVAKEREMYALAREAARRGIVIYTITVSETAFMYFKNLNPERAAELERLHGRSVLLAGFRLPVFVQTAELTRGRAVGSNSVRDLVKWLLAFGLSAGSGVEINRETVQDIIDWEGPAETEEAKYDPRRSKAQSRGRARPLIGRLKHDGGWNVPHNDAALLKALAENIEFAGAQRMQPVGFDQDVDDLFTYGLIYVSGLRMPRFTAEQKARLKRYVQSGGTLLIDPGCGSRTFLPGMRQLLAELFGPNALEPVQAGHAVFDTAYRIETVRVCESERANRYRTAPPRLEGITVGGRLGVIVSPYNLGCGWHSVAFGRPCHLHDDDALKLTINVIVYALQ